MSETTGSRSEDVAARPAELRVHVSGPDAALGRVPVADVVALLTNVERAVARAASVVIGRPSKSPGQRESVVAGASRLILRAVLDSESIEAVLELPTAVAPTTADQTRMELPVAQVGELAAEQLVAIVAGTSDGHPYVVEALSQIAESLQIGTQYDSVRFVVRDSHVSRIEATIDAHVRSRLRERVQQDRAATREGMVVGTLVEADFEAYSARLRGPSGRAVTVSFDPSLADDIQKALREPAALEGWIVYDPGSNEARSILIQNVRVADQLVLGIDARAFRRRRDFEELRERQGITGAVDIAALYDAVTPTDELNAYAAELERFREA